MLLSLTLALGVSAQRKGYIPVYRPHVYVTPYIGLGYGYGYPYFGYPSFGYPYNSPYSYRRMPYKLQLQIESINDDYREKIRQARKDKSLTHAQKRQEISTLKTEKEQEIINAKRDFSKSPRTNNDGSSRDNS